MDVTLVSAVVAAEQHALAAALERDAIHTRLGSADVMRDAPEARVYIFCFDAALAVAIAERVVEWARGLAGLIGVIPDGSVAEREALLAAGFDDVVAGRVSTRELAARIRAVHRRMSRDTTGNKRLRFGAFTLDVLNRTLWTQGTTIRLTATELDVVRELVLARGRPLSRADLLDAVWGGADFEVTERAVDNVILRIRRKLPAPDCLETVRGVGFRLA